MGVMVVPGTGSYKLARKWLTCEGGLGDLAGSGKRSKVNRAWEPPCGEGPCGETGCAAGHSDQNVTSLAKEAILGWEKVLEWL